MLSYVTYASRTHADSLGAAERFQDQSTIRRKSTSSRGRKQSSPFPLTRSANVKLQGAIFAAPSATEAPPWAAPVQTPVWKAAINELSFKEA